MFIRGRIPVGGFAFSFFTAFVSSSIFGLISTSNSSFFISTSSFSLDEPELGGALSPEDLDEKARVDCFAGGFAPLALPKNLLLRT
jgi:hypothetical protein